MQIFIPLILMYPFAFSPNNIAATGKVNFHLYLGKINAAFLICLLGIAFFFLGCYVISLVKKENIVLENLSRSYLCLTRSVSLLIYGLILLVLFLVMFELGFFGNFFAAREFGMSNPSLRPIANLFYSACTVYVVLALSSFLQEKSYMKLFYILIGIAFSLTSGTRGAVLQSILLFIFIYFNINGSKHSKLNILKIGISGVLILFAAIYLGDIREHQYNPLNSLLNVFNGVFFGNNFSDLRDFSWVLAYWNGAELWGKTLLSGALSFVPSSMFPFRAQWGIGVFTASTVGFDPHVHPGLRPGIFGESYFNFGLIGVCLFGFIYGVIINSISLYVQKAVDGSESIVQQISKVSVGYLVASVFSNIMITSGVFQIYTTLLILLIGYIVYFISERKKANLILRKKSTN